MSPEFGCGLEHLCKCIALHPQAAEPSFIVLLHKTLGETGFERSSLCAGNMYVCVYMRRTVTAWCHLEAPKERIHFVLKMDINPWNPSLLCPQAPWTEIYCDAVSYVHNRREKFSNTACSFHSIGTGYWFGSDLLPSPIIRCLVLWWGTLIVLSNNFLEPATWVIPL